MHDPYRAKSADRREIVVAVGKLRGLQAWTSILALLVGVLVLRSAVVSLVGKLALAFVAALVVVWFYRARNSRAVALSSAGVALVERMWPRRTLARIIEPQQVAVSSRATGSVLNGEPEISIDLVAERGKLSLRVLGSAAARQLEAQLSAALAELGMQSKADGLQGSIRERELPDGRIELIWQRLLPLASLELGIAAAGSMWAAAVLVLLGPRLNPLLACAIALPGLLVALAAPLGLRRTRLRVSSEGFSLQIRRTLRIDNHAGRGRLRAEIVTRARDYLPAGIDSTLWQLELESADGTRASVGSELAPHELRWLAARIGSLSGTR